MAESISIPRASLRPSVAAVLKAQGIPPEAAGEKRLRDLAEQAIARFETLAAPAGLVMEVTGAEFQAVYHGEGENAARTPLDAIYPRADRLALFAVTIGEPIVREISHLFALNEFALGAMLDAAASEGTERAAARLESVCHERHVREATRTADVHTLRFSPGYCGWHVSGQKKLFRLLGPESIGLTLSESCLMHPLKSISGVLVSGPAAIFRFEADFPFCSECDEPTCRERLTALPPA